MREPLTVHAVFLSQCAASELPDQGIAFLFSKRIQRHDPCRKHVTSDGSVRPLTLSIFHAKQSRVASNYPIADGIANEP